MEIVRMTHRIAGIELGGTKCVATLCDDQRRILDQTTVPTTSPDVTLPALSAILARWDRNTPFRRWESAPSAPSA
jgi:fructokinase